MNLHGPEAFTYGWWIFAAMVGTLLILQFIRRTPIGIALLIGAVIGGLVSGNGIPVRHLVEGAFTYFDPMLIIFTAMLFMRVVDENGALGSLARFIIERFSRRPVLLLLIVTLFIMFPAMLTGITTTSVLTTGALMAAPLMALGMPPVTTGVMIAMISIMGNVAPPINLLAMLIGQGVDMPYIGFLGPLAALAFPLAILFAFTLGFRHLRNADPTTALESLPTPPADKNGWVLYAPMLTVLGLMAATRLLPKYIPDIGVPLIFVIGALVGLFTGVRVNFIRASYRALMMALPVLGLLAGIGVFLQIMTLTGVRGLLVVTVLSLPVALTYVGMLISLPVFGGVSAFASAMVFGIPFLLALLGRNEIIVCSAIALLAALGDVMLPSAIEARFSAQVVGMKSFLPIVKRCLPFVLIAALVAIAFIYWAGPLGFLVP